MPSTEHGRNIWGDAIAAKKRYLVLFTAKPDPADPWANELADDHGYARGVVPPASMVVARDGDISLSADVTIYTADDDNAEDATHLAISDNPTRGQGNLLFYKSQRFSDIPAPQNERAVVIRSGVKIINLS